MLTIAGETFASRVAESLLFTLGLPELVTKSMDEYEALALELVRNSERLDAIRMRLRNNRSTSSLFDAERFARKLEQAYSKMWEIYSDGEQPRAFAV